MKYSRAIILLVGGPPGLIRSWCARLQHHWKRPLVLDRRCGQPEICPGDDSKIVLAAPLQGLPYNSARLSVFAIFLYLPSHARAKVPPFYFFLSDYTGQNFNRSSTVFSIEAGAYTLVKDFSSSSCRRQSLQFYNLLQGVRHLHWQKQDLNLTFSPSMAVPGSKAVINGIEVVSMPASCTTRNRTHLLGSPWRVNPVLMSSAITTSLK
ncbi:hypothetical protein MLD38_013160 [Melastoma candidum]|uniref:Uncharacterized protein n=1 Tax=Melastoma candidum TaxID=119954 RepID=A0ACB9R8R0_9MYRT|nr:hypothetical protein MLD38_013160 [Melastoma candidum]